LGALTEFLDSIGAEGTITGVGYELISSTTKAASELLYSGRFQEPKEVDAFIGLAQFNFEKQKLSASNAVLAVIGKMIGKLKR
jgi:hypothetical protein